MICLAALTANIALLFGQNVTKTGTTAAKFLSIGIGPQAIAMGGAYTAVAHDVSALYWNPAGIAAIDQMQAMFSYASLYEGIHMNYLGLIIPSGETGDFGISVTALNYGAIGVTTEASPDGTGETYAPASYAFGLSYARNITQ